MKTTRDEILYAAVKMFAKDGYEAVSMSMIFGKGGTHERNKSKSYYTRAGIL